MNMNHEMQETLDAYAKERAKAKVVMEQALRDDNHLLFDMKQEDVRHYDQQIELIKTEYQLEETKLGGRTRG